MNETTLNTLFELQDIDGSFQIQILTPNLQNINGLIKFIFNIHIAELLMQYSKNTKNQTIIQKVDNYISLISNEYKSDPTYFLWSLNYQTEKNNCNLETDYLSHAVNLLTSIEVNPGGPYYSNTLKTNKNISVLFNLQIWRFLYNLNVSLKGLSKYLNQFGFNTKIKISTYDVIEKFYYQKNSNKFTFTNIFDNQQISLKCQALTCIINHIQTIQKKSLSRKKLNPTQNRTLIHIEDEISNISTDIAMKFAPYIEEIKSSKSQSFITQLPQQFNNSYLKSKISATNVYPLNLATTYGWIAYTVFDHIWDRESKEDDLAVGTISLRKSHTFFRNWSTKKDWHIFVDNTFNTIDDSFTWETLNCRFKNSQLNRITLCDYNEIEKKYINRSFGLSLGVIAVLYENGYKQDSSEWNHISSVFSHFIASKQINDDAHDWYEDLLTGKINLANYKLIEFVSHQKIKYSTDDKSELQKLYWDNIIVDIMNQVINHANKALDSINSLNHLGSFEILSHAVNNQKLIAKNTLDERQKAIDFIKSFN